MEDLDIKELFLLFWNKKTEIILIILMLVIIGTAYSFAVIKPKYSASTTLVLATSKAETADASITQTDITLNSKLISTYRELIKSKSVLSEVIENLNIKGLTEQKIKNNISVAAVSDTELIKITVTDEDPNVAKQIANEIAKVFCNKIVEIYNISNVYTVDVAEATTTPSNINHTKDLIIFAFIGLVIAITYVLISNIFDVTIKNDDDVEKATGMLVLASIPDCEVETKAKKGGKR